MDKSTLSQYGWVVIVIIIIIILLSFTGRYDVFWTQFELGLENSLKPPIGTMEKPEDSADYYYRSIALDVDDVNAGTIGANADVDKEHAVAGITEKNGVTTVIAFKDSAETQKITPKVDMTINLNGKKVTSNQSAVIDSLSGALTIDGHLKGSAILADNTTILCVQARTGSLIVNGGTYTVDNTSQIANNAAGFNVGANTQINGATINVKSNVADGKYVYGINTNGTPQLTVSKTNINVIGNTSTYGIYAKGITEINDCKINTDGQKQSYAVVVGKNTTMNNSSAIASSNYKANADGTAYTATSSGIIVNKTANATLNNCYAKGIHSGVSSHGTITVNGGTYEGFAHGGFYFGGANIEHHVKNATIKQCDWFGNGVDYINDTFPPSCNQAAAYIGGNSDANNIKVYIDNCKFVSTKWAICLRHPSGEHDNTLYISNSKIAEGTKLRLDGTTHNIYLGTGNSFDVSSVHYLGSSSSQVHTTTETY